MRYLAINKKAPWLADQKTRFWLEERAEHLKYGELPKMKRCPECRTKQHWFCRNCGKCTKCHKVDGRHSCVT